MGILFPGQALRRIVFPLHLSGFRAEQGPAALPYHRADEGLPSQVLAFSLNQPGGQHHRVPASVGQLHQIRVSHIDNGTFETKVAVGHHRVGRIAFIKAKKLFASCRHDRMIMLGSSFRDDQIIIFPDMVQMGRLRGASHPEGAVEDGHRLSQHMEMLHIIFCQPDPPLFHAGSVVPHVTSSHDIGLPVIVKKERSIDSRNIVQPVGL